MFESNEKLCLGKMSSENICEDISCSRFLHHILHHVHFSHIDQISLLVWAKTRHFYSKEESVSNLWITFLRPYSSVSFAIKARQKALASDLALKATNTTGSWIEDSHWKKLNQMWMLMEQVHLPCIVHLAHSNRHQSEQSHWLKSF